MTTRGDLKVTAIAQPLVVQTIGHQQFPAGNWRSEVDPGHLRIDRRQRTRAADKGTCSEQQQQPAHDEYPKD
jgi:hypothetical protein